MKTKVVTDHANLKYLDSIFRHNNRTCMALTEFDFYIVHRPGQEHVVPDFLSRNPIDKYPEFDNYVLPPIEVSNFFALALSFDIPYHEPSTIERYFGSLYLSIFETVPIMFLVKK